MTSEKTIVSSNIKKTTVKTNGSFPEKIGLLRKILRTVLYVRMRKRGKDPIGPDDE